tara:strand:+ start:570 stop:1361 length:792 start_codon:yes stop_codon:yes gene_type:complete
MSSNSCHKIKSRKAENLLLQNKLDDAVAEIQALKNDIAHHERCWLNSQVGNQLLEGLVIPPPDQEWQKTISDIYSHNNPAKLPRVPVLTQYWLTKYGCLGIKRQTALMQFYEGRKKVLIAALRKLHESPKALTEKEAPTCPLNQPTVSSSTSRKIKSRKAENLLLQKKLDDAVVEIQELKNLDSVMGHNSGGLCGPNFKRQGQAGDHLLDGLVHIPTDQEWRKIITDIYSRYNPSKLKNVDNLMLHWKWRKFVLIEKLSDLYK